MINGSGIIDYPSVGSSVMIMRDLNFFGALIAKIRYEDPISPIKSTGGNVCLVR